MREDMDRVLKKKRNPVTNRMRKRKGEKKREAKIPDEERSSRDSGNLSRRWITGWNEFGGGHHPNHNPLLRYLRKQVGRLWDDIYSELRAKLSYEQAKDAEWMVERNVEMIEGEPYLSTNKCRVSGLYVNPETGMLCWAENKKPRRSHSKLLAALANPNQVWISEIELCEQKNGIWYLYRYTWHDRKVYYCDGTKCVETAYDHYVQGDISLFESCWICSSKKQLSGDEIKKYELEGRSH